MNRMRNIWTDLREKHLLPVVAALVALLIVVPVVLAKDSEAPPQQRAAVAKAPAQGAQLEVVTGPQTRVRRGRGRDPFAGSGGKKASGTVIVDTATKPTTDATSDTGSTKTPAKKPSSGGKTVRTVARTERVYQVDVRFGRGAAKRISRDVPRLRIFPSAKRPAVVLLGVRKGGRSVVFLVEDAVTVSGEGHCRPDALRCRTFEMRTGETELIAVTGADGVVRTYQLDLLGIPKQMMTKANAAEAYERASPAGSELLEKDGRPGARRTQLYGWRWDPDTGLLTLIATAAGTLLTGPDRDAPLVEPTLGAAWATGAVRGG